MSFIYLLNCFQGAQIIDLMILVIDIEKGVQTQTAECMIIGEICCEKLIVVLNKLDLIEETKREAFVEKMKKKLRKTFENNKFAECSIVAVSTQQALVIAIKFFLLF
jgi:selenocysteine-specific elongation factor